MNSNNIVKIGSALKWRSTYDDKKRYYHENIVTMCGCVFRCKVLLAQGKAPVRVIDDVGRIEYSNTDSWDVVVDMAYYYNMMIDCNDRIDKNEEAIRVNSENIEKNRIEIEEHKKETSLQIDSINASIRTLQDEFLDLEERHENDMGEIHAYQEAHDKEHELIDGAIGGIAEGIENIISELSSHDKRLDDIDVYHSEHEKVHADIALLIDGLGNRLDGIDTTISEHEKMIDELAKKVSEGGGGQTGFWDNEMLWMNGLYWSNGSSEEQGGNCCEEVMKRLDTMQQSINELNKVNIEQQTIIDKQQKQIEELFALIGSGISGTVKSYDEETRTITFGDHVSLDEYLPEIQAIKFGNMVFVTGYDESKEQVTIR